MALKLTVEFQTAVHHGSGFGLAGLVDRAVLRDERGMPYLGGSALKGKLRHAAAQVLAGTGREVCRAPDQPDTRWCIPPKACLLCRIFGSPKRPGRAIFEDAYPTDPEQGILRSQYEHSISTILRGGSDIRATTAMDRYYRRARPEHLFTTETVSRLIRFQSTIGGSLIAEERQLVVDAAKMLTHFGGDSARGLGLCVYRISEEAK